MSEEKGLKAILEKVREGKLGIVEAVSQLENENISDLGFAKIDNSRINRCGFPEFIYGEGKSFQQLGSIVNEICKSKNNVLATKISQDIGDDLVKLFPNATYDEQAKTFQMIENKTQKDSGILVISAGTTDLPVALEAKHTIEACCHKVDFITDVGVAGIHRLLSQSDKLNKAKVIIAVAGMEGALPSVIGGLVACPVIAVPTSVGYGSSLNGLTAMFAMLNSCASGITVVNINNGFGAGCAAVRIVN